MRKQVYVFDEYVSSQKNGIGSFLKEFGYCMEQLDADIYTFTFNANVTEFTIQTDENGKMERMLFPLFPQGTFVSNADVVIKFLRLYTQDSSDNVFFINHSPCANLVETLKRDYPLSKIVFTIHDLWWTSMLLGDVDKYQQLVKNELAAEGSMKSILDFHDQEVKTYNLVDYVVCLSPDTYHLLQTVYSIHPDKMFLISNGYRGKEDNSRDIDKKRLKKELFVTDNEKIVLYVGRPTMQKGMHALINAFHSVLKNNSNIRLVIIGSDNNSKMENLINTSSSFATRVSFLGLVNKEELGKWYSIADIGVIPSYYEQCSYVGVEMMMHGLPIVASDGFGVRNMFQDGVNALVAPIGKRENPEEFSCNLVAAIDKLLSSDELRDTLRRNAKVTYDKYYSVHRMQKGYEKLLASMD